jgi:uncharacterized protein (TIGR03435 family)
MRWMMGLVLGLCGTAWAQGPVDAGLDWQKAAGGAMAFDVASIRESKPDTFTPPSFPLSADDSFRKTGGEFSADFPLSVYIQFAYKIWPSPEQTQAMLAPLPKWVATKKFTVHAKAAGNPTKDQMRLMVQALLKERFGLEAHFASVDAPVLTMVLVHPGKLGPKLRRHEDGPPCRADGGRDVGVFPPECDVFEKMPGAAHAVLLGSRNATVELMGASLAGAGRLGRPVVDGTGIAGRVDFSVEYLPEMGADAPADAAGATFLKAAEEQLGIRFKAGRAPVRELVVDRVELPTEN